MKFIIIICFFNSFIFSNAKEISSKIIENTESKNKYYDNSDSSSVLLLNDTNRANPSKPSCNIYKNDTKQLYVKFFGIKYPKYIPLYHDKKINFTCLNTNIHTKRILLWNEHLNTLNYYYGFGSQAFHDNKCPVTNCDITNNRNLLNESDFIVIYMRNDIDELPKWKFNWQRWIFYEDSAPIYSKNLTYLNNLFDLSSTYRVDSSTTSMYYAESSYYWQLNTSFSLNNDIFIGKDKFAAVEINGCKDFLTIQYIEEIKQYIQIEAFGDCARECPLNDCKAYIVTKYKFYFAFETAFCKYYITDKFFAILKHDIIPVVLGAGPYDRYVPKSGYINALDYETPEQLANYLIYLSNNATAYNSYFKWKKYVTFDSYNPFYGHICEWCILLNLNEYDKLSYDERIKDMNSFWNATIDCQWLETNG